MRRWQLGIGIFACLMFLVGACSKSTTTTTPTTPASSPTQTASSTPSPTPTPTPTPTAASAAALVTTGMATASGTSKTVLTDASGRTLYYHTSDTATSVCSGGCASVWPPLLAPSGSPTGASLPGTLATIKDANGTQVTYQGHPLYRFSSDSAAGQAKGNGVAGIWFAATPDLKAA